MSPAWFSKAILTPAATASARTALHTSTAFLMCVSMPPWVPRSAWLPRKQRMTGEPTVFAIRMPSLS